MHAQPYLHSKQQQSRNQSVRCGAMGQKETSLSMLVQPELRLAVTPKFSRALGAESARATRFGSLALVDADTCPRHLDSLRNFVNAKLE
jgi:hypothetical protein